MKSGALDLENAQQLASVVSMMLAIVEAPQYHEGKAVEMLRQLTPFQRSAIQGGLRRLDEWIEKAATPEWPKVL